MFLNLFKGIVTSNILIGANLRERQVSYLIKVMQLKDHYLLNLMNSFRYVLLCVTIKSHISLSNTHKGTKAISDNRKTEGRYYLTNSANWSQRSLSSPILIHIKVPKGPLYLVIKNSCLLNGIMCVSDSYFLFVTKGAILDQMV